MSARLGESGRQPADLRVDWVETPGPSWRRCELELDKADFPLPFWHRELGVRCVGPGPWRLLVTRNADGTAQFGVAVQDASSRAMPGHRILRVQRLGAAGGAARIRGLIELVEIARRAPRILRVEIGTFGRNADARVELAQNLEALGFTETRSPRLYRETIVVELGPPEAQILASFHRQTRKNLRRIEREPFTLRAIEETRFAERLDQLLAETMARTSGPYSREDWATRIAISAERPALSRIAGLFREPDSGPEALLGFGWACHHGDHVEYCTSATTRIPGSRLPLAYSLAWDLIRWAKASRARWFDFGGVTAGGLSSEDPLGGVSDFKRSFSKHTVSVSSDWIFEPHPMRARVARTVAAARALLIGERGGGAR